MADKDIITISDIEDEMWDGFRKGTTRGENMHFPILTSHFRPLVGDVIVIGGISNMGKSAFWEQLCLIKAIKDGWVNGFYSPEQLPPSAFFNNLIHSYVGASTEHWHTNQMTETQYGRAIEFIKDKFFYVYAHEEDPTPDYINSKFEKLIKDHGVNRCTIDPFQGLLNRFKDEGSDDKYVSMFLKKEKRFALKHQIMITIITHPNSSVTMGKDGNYIMLQFHNLRGGASWAENSDCVLMFDRPFFATDFNNPLCRVYSAKIKKQKIQGLRGTTLFRFDYLTGRFYELCDGNDHAGLSDIPLVGGFSPLDEEPKQYKIEEEQEEKQEETPF